VYVCRNFDIRELVPYGVWKNTDNKQLLWWLFDDRMLKVADKLRDTYGKMVGNDWPTARWSGMIGHGVETRRCVGSDLGKVKQGLGCHSISLDVLLIPHHTKQM